MQTAVIIDIIVGAVLAAFVIFGAMRGLFRALAGLLILILALLGAGYLANLLCEPAANLLSPMLEQRLTERIETSLTDAAGQTEAAEPDAGSDAVSTEDALGLLSAIGLDGTAIDAVAQRIREGLANTMSSIAAAAAKELTKSIVYGLLYIVVFLLLTILLHLLAKGMDLLLKLPVLHGFNTLGGAVIGGVEGVLFLFLAIWAARKLGMTFFDSALAEKTCLLRFFAENTPLSVLALLR